MSFGLFGTKLQGVYTDAKNHHFSCGLTVGSIDGIR